MRHSKVKKPSRRLGGTKNWSLAGPREEIAAIRRYVEDVALKTGKLKYRVLYDAIMQYEPELFDLEDSE